MKQFLRTLFVVAVASAVPTAAQAQVPGAGNPWPGRPVGCPPGV